MWLIWSLFWTLAVICRLASQEADPAASMLLFALGCVAAAGIGWATATCAPSGRGWKEAIALMLGWSLAFTVGAPAMELVGRLWRAASGWHMEIFNLLLALALAGALLGALSAVVLINSGLSAAQRFKRGIRIVAGWTLVFPLAFHLSLVATYLGGVFLEVDGRALLILGCLLSGLLTGYLCSGLLAAALRPAEPSA